MEYSDDDYQQVMSANLESTYKLSQVPLSMRQYTWLITACTYGANLQQLLAFMNMPSCGWTIERPDSSAGYNCS